jgi:hypothetical protein
LPCSIKFNTRSRIAIYYRCKQEIAKRLVIIQS